jgi:hypothetical protein
MVRVHTTGWSVPPVRVSPLAFRAKADACQEGVVMLRYVTSTLTACALAGTVSVFAQQAPPAQDEKQPAPKETLTGCVIEAKTTDGGKAYVLNNVAGGSATMYVLVGSSQSDFATNVSKKVEVTGPVQHPSAPSADETGGNPKAVRPPIVQVESLKIVGETCK